MATPNADFPSFQPGFRMVDGGELLALANMVVESDSTAAIVALQLQVTDLETRVTALEAALLGAQAGAQAGVAAASGSETSNRK